jgi:uncharacterized protein related to proFAR isomerase
MIHVHKSTHEPSVISMVLPISPLQVIVGVGVVIIAQLHGLITLGVVGTIVSTIKFCIAAQLVFPLASAEVTERL